MTCRPDNFPAVRWPHGRVFGAVLAVTLTLVACAEPASDVGTLDQANKSLAAGDGLGAEIILRDMLGRGVPKSDIAALMGEAELQQGQIAEARRWLDGGDFSVATMGRGHQMLGRVELADGRLALAGGAFDIALRYMPENPELWVDIGRLRYAGGEHRQAVEASIRALDFGPNNAAALQFRIQLVRDAEGPAAALPLYEAALTRNPASLPLLGDYAASLGEAGRAADMLAIVRRMIMLDEGNSRAFYLQAVLAVRGGKFDLARNLLIRSGDLERGIPAALMLAAIIDLEKGNYASASQSFGRIERMQPDNARIQHLVARSLSLGGNHRELINRFGARALAPGAPPYLAALVGRSHEVLGRRDLAAPFLDLASMPRSTGLRPLPAETTLDVALSRGYETGRDTVALVRGLISAGQTASAITYAEAFLERVPGSADALTLAGDAYLSAGQGERASEYYARSAAIRRSWPLIRKMAAAEIFAGRPSAGLALLQRQLADNPANSEAAVMLAGAEMAAGDARRAATLLDHALAIGAGRDPEALVLRARSALQTGDTARARDAAMRAWSLQRMNTETAALLASIPVQATAARQVPAVQPRAMARIAATLTPR